MFGLYYDPLMNQALFKGLKVKNWAKLISFATFRPISPGMTAKKVLLDTFPEHNWPKNIKTVQISPNIDFLAPNEAPN